MAALLAAGHRPTNIQLVKPSALELARLTEVGTRGPLFPDHVLPEPAIVVTVSQFNDTFVPDPFTGDIPWIIDVP